ncbi:nodulation protein NodH [Chachezhania antarctica]|uniref:nodulation protein NodH n=1 Tax=Chachezhania antarctica TaxID=2340860 RepID=UPI000EB050C4|nr:nodulation protein NodH [Chachezhania antarctica]|tara:strand:- start:3996 stop:5444 length:1449 start_codon:yes stop_codon:yes gene_type:complete
MAQDFDYFVVLAGMRTGSNFLEANLNALAGVHSYGEVFNPHFIGYPKSRDVLGISQSARDADPEGMISTIRNQPGVLGGMRFFHDHDPRAFRMMLADPRCAKIVLTRNPLESYVSWKIAQSTGQWILTDITRRREAKALFRMPEFETFLEDLQCFQVRIMKGLQHGGQTAFYVGYEDLQDLDAMNGLAKWLGIDARLDSLDDKLIPQNPGPVASKVSNPKAMADGLATLDSFNLTRTPNFEPRRGPSVIRHVAGARAPVLYMPIRGGPEAEVERWLAALDSVSVEALKRGMNQKQMRSWKQDHPGHRSFTVVRHPLERAHHVFCTRVLSRDPGNFSAIRAMLVRDHDAPIPENPDDPAYTERDHRTAFAAYLDFVAANLNGQTAFRTDPAWASQWEALRGFGDFVLPDHVFRETEIANFLPRLAMSLGIDAPPVPEPAQPDAPFALSRIADTALENRAAEIYQRDYFMFGFETHLHPQGTEG